MTDFGAGDILTYLLLAVVIYLVYRAFRRAARRDTVASEVVTSSIATLPDRAWSEVADFVRDGVVRPVVRDGRMQVEGLKTVPFARILDHVMHGDGEVYEHPSGGLFLAKLDGRKDLNVFAERMGYPPTDLNDEDLGQFIPDQAVTEIERGEGRVSIKADVTQLAPTDIKSARTIVTMTDHPLDPVWMIWVTVVQAFETKRGANVS